MGKKHQSPKGKRPEREVGADGRRHTRLRPIPKSKYRHVDPEEWDENDEELDTSKLYYGDADEDTDEETTG